MSVKLVSSITRAPPLALKPSIYNRGKAVYSTSMIEKGFIERTTGQDADNYIDIRTSQIPAVDAAEATKRFRIQDLGSR